MNSKRSGLSTLILSIGIILIYFALNSPCSVSPISQLVSETPNEALSPETEIELPWQFERVICISTDFKMLIAIIIGTAFAGVGAASLARSIITLRKNNNF